MRRNLHAINRFCLVGLVIVGLLGSLLTSCSRLALPPAPEPPPVAHYPHLLLGNPSQAIASARTPDNYLMQKPQYALSYNHSRRTANWVSWQLKATNLGTVPRQNAFRPDERLPLGWDRVLPTDYSNSGYDRGHLTPAADRSDTPENNAATFLMTNILPQSPDNNQGPWAELENYCRSLVKQGKELYLVAGGYGQKPPISLKKIIPPAHLWKAIVVLDRPELGWQSINLNTRVIAVDLPNIQGIKETDWRTYRVSIAAIEQATGYDLLSRLPVTIRQGLRKKIDRA